MIKRAVLSLRLNTEIFLIPVKNFPEVPSNTHLNLHFSKKVYFEDLVITGYRVSNHFGIQVLVDQDERDNPIIFDELKALQMLCAKYRGVYKYPKTIDFNIQPTI